MRIRFGPSGNSQSFYDQGHTSTQQAPAWLDALGLDAFEYSFGRGVRITEKTANDIGVQMDRHDVQLSVHAPYYINLASTDEKNILSTVEHFVKSAQACVWLNGSRIVFHPGALGKDDRKEANLRIVSALRVVLKTLDEHGFMNLILCPETMGKINQIGDLDETIALCTLDERLIPCFDFGHLYARNLGKFGSVEDYHLALDKLENALGFDRASRMHIHFSRIEYSRGGEKRHLNYEDIAFGPDFDPLAQELYKRRYTPVVICESKTKMAEDSLAYKQIYQRIEKEKANE